MKNLVKLIKTSLICLMLLSWSEVIENQYVDALLIIRKDKGVILHFFDNKKTFEIFKLNNKKEYIDASKILISSDSLVFWVFSKDKLLKTKTRPIKKNGKYYRQIFSGSYEGKAYVFKYNNFVTYLHKTSFFEVKNNILHVIEKRYTKSGSVIDSIKYKSDILPEYQIGPFPDESRIIDNKQVISVKGNLYLIDFTTNQKKLLLKHRKVYTKTSPKFLYGFANPELSWDVKKVIFIDVDPEFKTSNNNIFNSLVNLFSNDEKTVLFELNLETREMKNYFLPVDVQEPNYSYSNRYVLLVKPSFPQNEYYVFDLNNKKLFTDVPNGNNAYWVYVKKSVINKIIEE